MAVTTREGFVRMTATTDSYGGEGDPVSLQSITIMSDSAATAGTVLTVQTNETSPVDLFKLHVAQYDSETLHFRPPRQFGQGIRVVMTSSGGVPANDFETTLVLA